MRILFLTNIPSPYRVDFFNLLGKSVDLTVLFSSGANTQNNREKAWFKDDYANFHAVFLKCSFIIGGRPVCIGVLDYLKQEWDMIISGGYSEPTQILAFEWMNLHHIPFYMESDGGFIKRDGVLKRKFKQHYISMPDGWFSSGRNTDQYLIHYGAREDKIIHYPFTSIWASEIEEARLAAKTNKLAIREELGIQDQYVVLAVGRFIRLKGFEVLIQSAAALPQNIGVYIVGGEPTEEYLSLCKQFCVNNVHFIGFKPKEELKNYYMVADVFAMPTRSDIWGLVVNEALSYGLPVVSSDQCGAALELIENGKNGYIVPVNDHAALADAILNAIDHRDLLSKNAFLSIADYSIENMVKAHLCELLNNTAKFNHL